MAYEVIGYCRTSTPRQSIERQRRNIRSAYPDAVLIEEVFTGTKVEGRKKFEKLLADLKQGQTLVVDSVSRLSRDAAEGIKIYEELYAKGVSLVFLKEPQINTDVYRTAISNSISLTGEEVADIYIEATNRVLRILARRQIELAFEQAQKEVQDLRQRTKEGLVTARNNGKQLGARKGEPKVLKKKVQTLKTIKKHSRAFDGTLSDRDVMRLADVSNNTYYKYKSMLLENPCLIEQEQARLNEAEERKKNRTVKVAGNGE